MKGKNTKDITDEQINEGLSFLKKHKLLAGNKSGYKPTDKLKNLVNKYEEIVITKHKTLKIKKYRDIHEYALILSVTDVAGPKGLTLEQISILTSILNTFVSDKVKKKLNQKI